MDIFNELFGTGFANNLKPEDRPKAKALLAVVCKSTASLADVVTLADELGLKLHFSATSKPEPEKKDTPEDPK